MGAPSKRAKKTRSANEFDLVRLAAEIRPPKASSGLFSWDLDAIRGARDAQMRGAFALPARLVQATRTDYAIFASFLNRLAPQRGLPVELIAPNDSARAERVTAEAAALFGPRGVGIHPDTLADIDGTLANHGVAFGINVVTPRDDGSRVDIEHRSWPIEFVRWDMTVRGFRTRVEGLEEETICHGDGRWVIYQQHEHDPWTHGAILAVALLWADHAFGVRDRAKASNTHGNAKIVGTMPESVALQEADSGKLTPEATAFLHLLRDVASADTPVGIKPFGSTLDYITNASSAWQIFKEIIDSGDKAADRVYLGHDITVSGAGGDAVGYLFGVRNDIVEGSLRAIERGLRTGVIEPWAAMNFGDSSLAPDRVYMLPDADEDARRKSLGDRTNAFHAAIEAAKKNSFDVTEKYVKDLADEFGIIAPPLPVATTSSKPTVTLAPTDVARVVSVNEARASAGLGPLLGINGQPDPDGRLTVEEFSAKKAAAASAPPGAPPGAPPMPARTPGPPVAVAARMRAARAPVVTLYDPSQPRADDGKFGEGPGSGGGGDDDPEKKKPKPEPKKLRPMAAHEVQDAMSKLPESKHATHLPTVNDAAASAEAEKIARVLEQSDPEAAQAIMRFTGSSFLEIRGVDTMDPAAFEKEFGKADAAEGRRLNADLARAMDKLPSAGKRDVYRGVRELTPEQAGYLMQAEHLESVSFASSSRDPAKAHGFASPGTFADKKGKPYSAVFVLDQSSGVAVEGFADKNYKPEREILLKRGKRYKVTEVGRSPDPATPNRLIIRAVEMDDGEELPPTAPKPTPLSRGSRKRRKASAAAPPHESHCGSTGDELTFVDTEDGPTVKF
jgi:hypothetical protein